MGGLFQPKESSSQDDNVSDGDEAVPTQDTSAPDTAPDTNMAVADDESPF